MHNSKRLLVLISGFSLLATGLVLVRQFPLSLIPGSRYYFYRDPRIIADFLNIPGICYAISAAMLPVVAAVYRKKLGNLSAVLLLTAGFCLLNIFAYRPLYLSWTMRTGAFADGMVNPFSWRGMGAMEFCAYPREHMALAGGGYLQASLEQRRLTTYPPGMPMLHHGIMQAANKNTAFRNALDRLAEIDGKFLRNPVRNPEIRRATVLSALFYMFCLALVPGLVFILAMELGNSGTAIRLAALSCLIPAAHLFASSEGAVLTPLLLGVLLACLAGVRRRSPSLLLLAGFLVGGAMFFSYVTLPLILVCTLLIVAECPGNGSRRATTGMLLAWLGGWLLVLLAGLPFGFNALKMLMVAIRNNHAFYADAGRGFIVSILANAVEFPLFFGVAPVLAGILATWIAGRHLWRFRHQPACSPAKPSTRAAAYAVCYAASLVLLLISGGVRGEVGRNWLPLMPMGLLCLAATPGLLRRWFAGLQTLSFVHLLAMAVMLEVVFGFWTGS